MSGAASTPPTISPAGPRCPEAGPRPDHPRRVGQHVAIGMATERRAATRRKGPYLTADPCTGRALPAEERSDVQGACNVGVAQPKR